MERDHFLSTTDDVALPSPAMTWHLPPVPEQSLDCFFNPNYDPIKGQFILEKLPNFGNKVLINPSLPSVSADPGFAERAERFSPFGSHSFNSRNNTEFQQNFNSNQNLRNLKLTRVSSTPSIKSSNYLQTQMEIRPINGLLSKFDENGLGRTEFASPNDGSSVSEQIPIGETEEKNFGGSSSRKRKSVSRVKSQKVLDEQNDRDSKRCKSKTSENKGIEKCNGKKEEKDESEDDKSDEADAKAPEPLKDYIHVRTRRGQATDSHSLAERVRREKISERMKFLQDLVPGCNKVTGKALMLDEIINYVQSLQRQVEFLSMKLATVDPVDFNTDSLLSKNVNNSTDRVDSSSLFGQRKQEIHQAKTDFLNKQLSINCSLDPSDTTMYRDISSQLPFVGEFGQGFPQLLGSYDDELQSIVQMGFGQNPGLHLQTFPDSNETHARSHMSIEL